MKFKLHSFGCKVNTYDSGLIQKNLAGQGFTTVDGARSATTEDEPRIHILNTCAVTAEATKEAVRLIRKLKARDPLATVVVTGCAAQVDTGSFENLPGADLVVANSHKGDLPRILDQHFKGTLPARVLKSNIFRKDDLEAGGGLEENHSRAFLKIQDGCNSFCSYCIIPYARGKSRSIPIKDLVARVNELTKLGFEEVVLTGVHIGDYEDVQAKEPRKLEDLVENVLKYTKIPRIRLTSLEPVEVSERLLELYVSDVRLCRHFHMSIQSGSTAVLKDMKRHYGEKEVRESLARIRERLPDAFIGMDVIAGFPTETEELFEETYRTLNETPWTRLHVFPYSERKGTRAETFKQIPNEVRKARARRLRELSLARFREEADKQLGLRKEVLLLKDRKPENDSRLGLSRDYWNILIDGMSGGEADAPGEIPVEITGYRFDQSPRMEGVLLGRPVGGRL
ncbi:MAG: tRNA (N(6)-L-threonylcarbamoyladenosine(37)-C(2))-methylthiotransferase MtaB [Bdellovibrionaceae bacterium]|nr:tRNA (N(6)-L-threonylcarbamoyladenosine(37)-C(2))-methylthiotransferase MtaB [Pseudobdellovibrionaceae bacterium]